MQTLIKQLKKRLSQTESEPPEKASELSDSPALSEEPVSLDERLAKPMFALSLLFLVLIAALVVLWVDIPRVDFLAEEVSQTTGRKISIPHAQANIVGNLVMGAILCLWPVFIAEFIYKKLTRDRSQKASRSSQLFDVGICLCPPLRLAAPNEKMDGKIWLPKLHWQTPGKQLTRILERSFGAPMLVIALFIVPILLIEFGLKEQVEKYVWLRLALHISTGLIWVAFAIEFLVMICATDRKLKYVKRNWIDLAIILLPLISFLRSLRALRVLRVTQLGKVQQLTKLSRIYRLRGLLTKALKAMLLLEFLNRLLRVTPEKKLKKLIELRAERAEELEEIDDDIRRLEREIEEDKSQNELSQNELETSSEPDALPVAKSVSDL